MLSVTRLPPSSAATSWRPTVVTPGVRGPQVNRSPGDQLGHLPVRGGIFGWCTLARDPTPNGPASRRSTLSTVGVHPGHRATSDST